MKALYSRECRSLTVNLKIVIIRIYTYKYKGFFDALSGKTIVLIFFTKFILLNGKNILTVMEMEKTEVGILLVEDNQEDAELTIRALKKNNLSANLVHVKDGAEALEFIFCNGKYSNRNFEIKPKIILLDLKMPKVNGMEVLQEIKSNEDTKAIPVIVLTSSKEDPDIKTCYQRGANSYIVKPVGFDNFTKAVSELGMYWLLLNTTK
jgi:two-component system response regulator